MSFINQDNLNYDIFRSKKVEPGGVVGCETPFTGGLILEHYALK
jgi:hypothetical protein